MSTPHTSNIQAAPPLSLYVHIPWCLRKCPYCDFNSHAVRDHVPETEYVNALLADLEVSLPNIWGRRVISVFMGGGTPSLFSGQAINKLIQGIRSRLNLLPDCEITMEANPGASDSENLAASREAGVNRLSLGIQSFDDHSLERLGRIHNSDDAHRAIASAKTAGYDNINLDLMFGLPEQDTKPALSDLQTALQYNTPHLSLYQLTIEANTLFASRPPPLPDDDSIWSMQSTLQSLLDEQGYDNYEVSAYATPGGQCIHNMNYWQFGDYLGIGAGAHSKLTLPDRIIRFAKRRHPRDYMTLAGSPDCLTEHRTLDEADIALEFMLNALRLSAGFDIAMFEQHTRLTMDHIKTGLQQAMDREWLLLENNMVRPTALGRRYLNDVISLFLP